MKYQWGHKDPFTFATSSEQWGNINQRGKYPVKIYTIDGVLIYQESNGSTNKEKQPVGGIISSSTYATSMMGTIKNPITFYTNPIINQDGHTRSLSDYYWTSYSRGTDGHHTGNSSWHDYYLDSYTSQRSKSIYDPCPYGFRVPINGTYNDFNSQGWIKYSYTGDVSWSLLNIKTLLVSSGMRDYATGSSGYQGITMSYTLSTKDGQYSRYALDLDCNGTAIVNRSGYAMSYGWPVRCIEVSPPRPTDETVVE